MRRTVPGWTVPPPGSIPGLIPLSRIRAQPTPEQLVGMWMDLAEHLTAWAESVVPGATATADKILNCSPTCGCPDGLTLAACKGPRLGIPAEIVRDFLIPPDGTPCTIPAVEIITTAMPFQIRALGGTA